MGADLHVRAELPADRLAVRELLTAAFGEHGRVVAALADDLRELPGTLSLVAERDGELAGNLMFTQNLLDAPRELVTVQVLSPVGVLPDLQRQGVGAAMIREGLHAMADRSVPAVFLEGDPAYYSRFGFRAGADQGFRKPSLRIPDPAFQALPLPAHQPWMTGTLVYAEPFWRHDCVGLREPPDASVSGTRGRARGPV